MCGQGGEGGVGGSGRGVGKCWKRAAWLTSTPAAIVSPEARLDTTEQYTSNRKTHEAETTWLYWPTSLLTNFKRISRFSVLSVDSGKPYSKTGREKRRGSNKGKRRKEKQQDVIKEIGGPNHHQSPEVTLWYEPTNSGFACNTAGFQLGHQDSTKVTVLSLL